MRAFLILPFLALPALAEDFTLSAPVTDVTVYPQGARLTREAMLSLPAGTHRILLPLTHGLADAGLPQVSMTGEVTVLGTAILPQRIADPERAFLPSQTAAQAAFDAAQMTVTERKTALDQGRATLTALDAQLAFLRSTSAASLTDLDASKLSDVAQLLGTKIAEAEAQKLQITNDLRPLQDALAEAETTLAQARLDLTRLTPPTDAVDVLAISVSVNTPVQAALTVEGLTYAAGWAPQYDLHLTSGTQATLQMVRKVAVFQSSGTPWEDVTLHLSTADPTIAIAPDEVWQDKVEMYAPQRTYGSVAEPMMAPSVAMEMSPRLAKGLSQDADTVFQMTTLPGGLSVQYDYPVPVSVLSGNERLVLNLDTLDLPTKTFVRAVPKYDTTAFLMATVTNKLSEPLLPGQASLYRDGTFIGQGALPLIVAGADEDLPFGALEQIRLSYQPLTNNTGDRGLISTSNTRTQTMEFTVENLMPSEQVVQTLFALPFSEQEDLEIVTRARPQPTQTDWDKKRNVGLWDLTLAPGQKTTVTVDVTLTWPDGQQVDWQP